MSSLSSISERNVPQQDRASRRLETILEAAEQIFAELGYEAATMTAIAERSSTSIGGLYRYFPDKPAVARALVQLYAQQVASFWGSLIHEAKQLSFDELARKLVTGMEEFTAARPGYLPLMAAPIKFTRDSASRRHLRLQLSKAFRAKKPSLSPERALLIANVALQIIKGMTALFAESSPKERPAINAEFTHVLARYLGDVLE